jgi:hypothetical protein
MVRQPTSGGPGSVAGDREDEIRRAMTDMFNAEKTSTQVIALQMRLDAMAKDMERQERSMTTQKAEFERMMAEQEDLIRTQGKQITTMAGYFKMGAGVVAILPVLGFLFSLALTYVSFSWKKP